MQNQKINETINTITTQNADFLDEYLKLSSAGEYNQTLFSISMIRLKSSFEAAMLLISNGYFVEVSSIFRLIMEQLSWGCYLFSIEKLDSMKQSKTLKSPQETISYLKTALEQNALGTLYGTLSAEAHLPLKEIARYLEVGVTEGRIDIILRSQEGQGDEIPTLILLLLLYIDVTWRGINRFGFTSKTQEAVFTQRHNNWYEEVLIQLCALKMLYEQEKEEISK